MPFAVDLDTPGANVNHLIARVDFALYQSAKRDEHDENRLILECLSFLLRREAMRA